MTNRIDLQPVSIQSRQCRWWRASRWVSASRHRTVRRRIALLALIAVPAIVALAVALRRLREAPRIEPAFESIGTSGRVRSAISPCGTPVANSAPRTSGPRIGRSFCSFASSTTPDRPRPHVRPRNLPPCSSHAASCFWRYAVRPPLSGRQRGRSQRQQALNYRSSSTRSRPSRGRRASVPFPKPWCSRRTGRLCTAAQ